MHVSHRFAFCLVGLLSCLLGGQRLSAQSFNRIHPPHLFDYAFDVTDSTDYGYYLFTPFKFAGNFSTTGFRPIPLILDAQGYVLWYGTDTVPVSVTDLKYDPVTDRYLYLAQQPVNAAYVLGPNMQVLDTLRTVGGLDIDIHDIALRPDGVRILHGMRDSVFDLSADTLNGAPGSPATVCICHVIQEIDSLDQLRWEWNSCDHLHPSLGYDHYGYNPSGYDYAHFNALDTDTDGNYLVSYRHMNAIVKIDRQADTVMWVLGGKANQFTFTNSPPFSGQHDVQRLPNGDLSLFDNANMGTNPNSRALQLSLDVANRTATRTFAYRPTPAFPARAMGSYQVTDSAQLINYGLVLRPRPSAELINANRNLLVSITFADSVMSYRGVLYRPNAPFPRPQVNCSYTQGQIYLDGPLGHSSYLWSTGETTQSILAQAGTTYQLWVPHGNGMLGSLPVRADTLLPCSPLGITPSVETAVYPVGVYDLLGRLVTERKAGVVYVERLTDGRVRKVVGF
jgi:hypothetical protein